MVAGCCCVWLKVGSEARLAAGGSTPNPAIPAVINPQCECAARIMVVVSVCLSVAMKYVKLFV